MSSWKQEVYNLKLLFTNPIPVITYGLSPALSDLGVQVNVIDVQAGLDQDSGYLRSVIAAFNPDYIFSPGGWEIDDRFIQTFKQHNIPLVFWAIDDPVLFKTVSLRHAKMSKYVFTTASECVSQYKKHGITAHLLMFACLPSFHHQATPVDDLVHDCILVGNNYDSFPSRLWGIEVILKPLLENSYDVKIFGNRWWLDSSRPFSIDERFYGGYLDYENMRKAYSSARIVLGVHSVNTSPTMMSMRTFEALACGAFFLTQWTPAIEKSFTNHEHLVWSKSPEETIELVNYYLAHPKERERIARSGQEEVYAGHTYHQKAQDVLQVLSSASECPEARSRIYSWQADGSRLLRSMTVKKGS